MDFENMNVVNSRKVIQAPSLIFDVLEVLEFDNFRKRMSVVVRDREGGLRLLIKGADSSMIAVAAPGQEDDIKLLKRQLADLAHRGLRTLVLGCRDLSPEKFSEYRSALMEAKNLVGDEKDEAFNAVVAEIEQDILILGCTGVEDKLQEDVAVTIAALKSAGVKLWVLTGDKLETAISIGHSCNILTESTYNAIVDGQTREAVEEQLRQYMSFIVAGQLAAEAFQKLAIQAYQDGDGTESEMSSPMDHDGAKAASVKRKPLAKCGRCIVDSVTNTGQCKWSSGASKDDDQILSPGPQEPPSMPWAEFVRILNFNAATINVKADPKQRKAKKLSPEQVDNIIEEYIAHFDNQGEEPQTAARTAFTNARRNLFHRSSGTKRGGSLILGPSASVSRRSSSRSQFRSGSANLSAVRNGVGSSNSPTLSPERGDSGDVEVVNVDAGGVSGNGGVIGNGSDKVKDDGGSNSGIGHESKGVGSSAGNSPGRMDDESEDNARNKDKLSRSSESHGATNPMLFYFGCHDTAGDDFGMRDVHHRDEHRPDDVEWDMGTRPSTLIPSSPTLIPSSSTLIPSSSPLIPSSSTYSLPSSQSMCTIQSIEELLPAQACRRRGGGDATDEEVDEYGCTNNSNGPSQGMASGDRRSLSFNVTPSVTMMMASSDSAESSGPKSSEPIVFMAQIPQQTASTSGGLPRYSSSPKLTQRIKSPPNSHQSPRIPGVQSVGRHDSETPPASRDMSGNQMIGLTAVQDVDSDMSDTRLSPHIEDGEDGRRKVDDSTAVNTPSAGEKAVQGFKMCAITITGEALTHTLSDETLKRYFFALANLCQTVIACRVSPKQKSEVVLECKRFKSATVSLGIGDGANDVGMLISANIGVGIAGKEGLQAVRAADFAIGEFRFLRNLMFCHGKECLRRNSFQLYQTIWKNVIIGLANFFFAFVSVFSAADIFNPWLKQLYNVLYTTLPVMLFSIFDRQLPYDILLRTPALYPAHSSLGSGMFVGSRIFWRWCVFGFYVCPVLVFFPLYALNPASNSNDSVRRVGLNNYGATVFWAIVLVSNLVMIPFLHTWFWFIWGAVLLNLGLLLLSWWVCPLLPGAFCPELTGSIDALFPLANFHFILILSVTTSLLPQLFIWFHKITFHPSASYIIRERMAKGVFDVVVAPEKDQKMTVVVPKSEQNEWRGYAFAEQENTRWIQHKRLSMVQIANDPSGSEKLSSRQRRSTMRSRSSRRRRREGGSDKSSRMSSTPLTSSHESSEKDSKVVTPRGESFPAPSGQREEKSPLMGV